MRTRISRKARPAPTARHSTAMNGTMIRIMKATRSCSRCCQSSWPRIPRAIRQNREEPIGNPERRRRRTRKTTTRRRTARTATTMTMTMTMTMTSGTLRKMTTKMQPLREMPSFATLRRRAWMKSTRGCRPPRTRSTTATKARRRRHEGKVPVMMKCLVPRWKGHPSPCQRVRRKALGRYPSFRTTSSRRRTTPSACRRTLRSRRPGRRSSTAGAPGYRRRRPTTTLRPCALEARSPGKRRCVSMPSTSQSCTETAPRRC
mmetsp:Transcript_9736/g.36550  ORF Transcript_9736/g.36550 Transcript_9736/m.36550 type:complete len:260 (-) Transcript_9736:2823-3602(-)